MSTIDIITASAGSGKTYRLAKALSDAIREGRVRPEAVVATTFTNKAAAELQERARKRLLEDGRPQDAHRLMAARIGTVNSVCGRLVQDHAFELGLPPSLTVWDDNLATRAQARSLAAVVTYAEERQIAGLERRLGEDVRKMVSRVIELMRTNDIDVAGLQDSAARSLALSTELLGPKADDGEAIDRDLQSALQGFIDAYDPAVDGTKGTKNAVTTARRKLKLLASGLELPWSDWASLSQLKTTKKSAGIVVPVHEAAARHDTHPRLHEDLEATITLVFDLAARACHRYQEDKRAAGALDFTDQESLALSLLRRDDVRARLAEEIDLVLVDEFQDTSPIQLAIFIALASLAPRSIWVGDPKQAIFGFRGTDPRLMERAIAELESLERSPDAAAEDGALGITGAVESLGFSYRSRPELVNLTSELFAPAFAAHGIDEDRTRLEPKTTEPEGLSEVVEVWPLRILDRRKTTLYTKSLAAGLQSMLQRAPEVRIKDSTDTRPVELRDVAVLCRTNDQCESVARELEALGIRAAVARTGLLDTAEGRLAMAALRLRIDPKDDLAAAEIARIKAYSDDVDGWLEGLFADEDSARFSDEVAAVRAAHDDGALDPIDLFDSALSAAEVSLQCARWGDTERRLANLDALRGHAVTYAEHARTSGLPATAGGLIAHLLDLSADGFGRKRSDNQAFDGASSAVTVSTWHKAKGLEWPVTVLFGLDQRKTRHMLGVYIAHQYEDFDLLDPLKDRWIRYVPSPFKSLQKGAEYCRRVEAHEANQEVIEQARREELRLLYVGWTRARDILVLAVNNDKFLSGSLTYLNAGEERITSVSEPEAPEGAAVPVRWGGRGLDVGVYPASPAEPRPTPPRAGQVSVPRPTQAHPAAYVTPSSVEGRGTTKDPTSVGVRLRLDGAVDMARLGNAIHGFLAADRPTQREPASDEERAAIAQGLLDRFGVPGAMDPADIVRASTLFRQWVDARWPGAVWRVEWPLLHRLPTGQTVRGSPDLVLELEDSVVVIDHKSYPGTLDEAAQRAAGHAGQLSVYASGVAEATGKRVEGCFIHLPVLGQVIEVQPA